MTDTERLTQTASQVRRDIVRMVSHSGRVRASRRLLEQH